MNRISHAIQEIGRMESYANQERWLTSLHALAKLLVTIAYLITVLSVDKYDIAGLVGMLIYPLVALLLGGLPISQRLSELDISCQL